LEKIGQKKKKVDANKDASVTPHMPQVSANYVILGYSWLPAGTYYTDLAI